MKINSIIKITFLTAIYTMPYLACSGINNDDVEDLYDTIYAPLNQKNETELPTINDFYVGKDTIILYSESAESKIGMIEDIKQIEDTLFIQGDNSIYLFKTDGSFIRKINRKGRGHGEYLNLTHFDIGRNRIHVLDVDLRRILVYNFNGDYIRQVQFDDIVFDFAVLENGDYLLYNPELYEGDLKRGLWQTDSLYKTYKQLVTIKKSFQHTYISPRWLIHINDHTVGLMGAEDSDLIYAITKDSVKVTAKVTTDIVMKKKYSNKRTPYITHTGKEYAKVSYYETDNMISFSVNNMFDSRVNILYNKNSKKTYRIYPSDVERITSADQLVPIISHSYNGNCYSVIYASQLTSMQSLTGTTLDGLTMDSNPVILIYSTK